MSDSNPSQLILAVPGPEQMRSFPKQMIRAAIAKGEIRRSQLIWSPLHNEWKQVRELPHLMPTQELAPTPVVVPRVAVVAKAVPVQSALRPASRKIANDDHHDGPPYLTIIIVLLSLILLGTLGANYVLVDQPYRNNLPHQGLGALNSHAHLISFYRTSGILIHIFPSVDTSADKLANVLQGIAKSTPPEPLSSEGFGQVMLSHFWSADFAISGYNWQKFASMDQATTNQQIDFLIQHLEDKSGTVLYKPAPKPQIIPDRIDVMEAHASRPRSLAAPQNDSDALSPKQLAAWKKVTSVFAPQ